jgi:hypothetical protein
MVSKASEVVYGGEVASTGSSPAMGSGVFGNNNPNAAIHSVINYLDLNGQPAIPTGQYRISKLLHRHL